MSDNKKVQKIIFGPGCFDDFEGTQEELDQLINEITRLVESGELFENSVELDIDNLDEMEKESIKDTIDMSDQTSNDYPHNTDNKKLH
jgi:hypothetical protein